RRLPGADLEFLAAERGAVRTDNGMLTLIAEGWIAEVARAEIVLVPGGPGEVAARAGGPVLEWLRRLHETTTWTTSVCTGSLILAAAGLLEGRRATSHWLALGQLAALGAEPVSERVVFDGKIVTAAGVSAGIDMALEFAARVAGEQVAPTIQVGARAHVGGLQRWGRGRHARGRRRRWRRVAGGALVRAGDASLPERRAAHRPSEVLCGRRCDRPPPAQARPARAAPHGL